MENNLLSLGQCHNRLFTFDNSGHFNAGEWLPAAWLAFYTPLDGAMLLTPAPPPGFLGANTNDMQVHFSASTCQLTFNDLQGSDLTMTIHSDWDKTRSASSATEKPFHFKITVEARSRVANLLPLGLAFSWQSLSLTAPQSSQPGQQSVGVIMGDGLQIHLGCESPRVRFTTCLGWNPLGSGEEVWDDFFAYGELGNQVYDSSAAAVCAHVLLPPHQSVVFNLAVKTVGE